MAIYHFSAKVIGRGAGRSAVAAAAYRSASRLEDERLGRHHDFTNKAGVVHSEVMLPKGAPEHLRDREVLWNEVEATEKRKDAQLAREVEFAIPREMTKEQGVALARDFVQREFVTRGMIADLNVHWDRGADGEAKPHAHVMLTMREIEPEGFGAKVREWNATALLQSWRENWADHVNQRCADLGIETRIDYRSLQAQGIDLEPQHKIGPAASRMAEQGLSPERLAEHHAIARANGDRIIAHPEIALDAITPQQATFTTPDLARFVHRHTDGKEQFDRALAAMRASPDLVALGRDGRGQERFTSRAMIETEQRLERSADALASRAAHRVPAAGGEYVAAGTHAAPFALSPEQRAAVEHVTRGRDLAMVVGYAGSGKSAMLGVAREAWEDAGYTVRGAALSGIAAENLEAGSGIASRTIAAHEHQWAQGREQLSASDVLVIDEAGMIGSRQMERVVSEAEKHGAKIVLVGDAQQLQAIEAGAAFRSLVERHGSAEITDIRRQREDWQKEATRQLATGRTDQALRAYGEKGFVHVAETREEARGALIERWDRGRIAAPGDSRIILTHTRDEARALNEAARDKLRDAGALGDEVRIATTRGARAFAPGDRVMFLRNERSLGVKNGSLGIVETVTPAHIAARLDDGRAVSFDVKDYADLDHGYAATIHKAQGMTVDHAHVLATPGLDQHSSYVALSRHRASVALHYGRDDFADRSRLATTLSRERAKDMASDYSNRAERSAGIGVGREEKAGVVAALRRALRFGADARRDGEREAASRDQRRQEAGRSIAQQTAETTHDGHVLPHESDRAQKLRAMIAARAAAPPATAESVREALAAARQGRSLDRDSEHDRAAGANVAQDRNAGKEAHTEQARGKANTAQAGTAAESDQAKQLREMIAARRAAPQPTAQNMRDALAAAKATPGIDRDYDAGAER